jgi:hypothetical protein
MNAKQRRTVARETLNYFRELSKDQQEIELAELAIHLRKLEGENRDLREQLMKKMK